jgi:hypothetical protein
MSTSASAAAPAKDANPFSTASITAMLAEILVADRHSPPNNGKAAFERVERSLSALGLFDFTASEFCQPSDVQDTTRVAQLRAKQAKDAAAALSASSSSSGNDGSSPSPKVEVKYDGNGQELDPETHEILSHMAAYAPRSMVSTTNALSNFSSMAVVRYHDPITELPETQALAGQRAVAQSLLERVFMPHHAHVIVSCKQGDIAAIWSLARQLCVGDATAARLDTITSMVQMVRSPPPSWPELSHLITQIQMQLTREQPQGGGMELGWRLLPEFIMRALQSTNYDHLRVEIALLHKISSAVTTERIQQDMTAAHALSVSRPPPARALVSQHLPAPTHAPTPEQPPRTKKPCFNIRDHGTCKYGDACRYDHGAAAPSGPPQLSGVCAACSSPSHGINQCPVHKASQLVRRKAGTARAEQASLASKAQSAEVAKLSADVTRLSALLSKARPAAAPAAPAPPAPADFAAENQRLRAQLAASYSNNPYFAYAAGQAEP